MKFVIAISTLLLCLVTLSSTVLFWSSMPTDIFGKALAAVTATALEACKYSFFPAGWYYLKKRNLGGAGLLLMGVVLLCISVAATTGFLESAYNQQTKAQQQNSLEYQTKKQQLNSLQQQIATLNNLIAADAAGSYRTRALQTAQQVKKLEQARDQALAELKNTHESPTGNAQSLFSAMAAPLGASPDSVRQGAFMALAVIVDICAIAALLALGGLGKKSAPGSPVKNTETSSPAQHQTQQQKPGQAPAKKQTQPVELNEKEQEIAQKILAGTYGQTISVRNAIAQGKTSHAIVNKVLSHLLEKNQVKRDGKMYQLVQPGIF